MKRDRPKQLHLSMLDKKLAETVVVHLPGGRLETFRVKGSAVTQRLVRFINTMVLPVTPDILDGANLNRVRFGTGEDFKEMEFQGDLWLNYYLGSMVFKILRRMYGQRRWTRTISGHLSGCVRSNAVFSMLGFRICLALNPTSKSTADRFEAMVHGLRQDANKSQLEPWIEKIFTPLIEEGCLVVAQRLPGNPQRIDLPVPSGSQMQPAYHEDDDGYIIIDDDSDDETEIIEVLSAASGTEEAEVAELLARPSASPPPPSTTQELYNYKATVIDVYPDSIRVHVPKLGERAYFGVELARCAQAVESYKHNPQTNQLEIVWKAAAGEDEEDDEIQMDCFTSAIAVGCSTRVWVPYRDMKLDRKADTTLVHPWDRRATLTVEQIS